MRDTIGEDYTEVPIFDVCPTNQTRDTDPGHITAKVVWINPTAVDNSHVPPQVRCKPGSGSYFTVGLTNVTCLATDDYGNTATCSFEVYIEDNEAPVFVQSCPVEIIHNTLPNQSYAHVQLQTPNCTDNSGEVPNVNCDGVPESNYFVIGQTIITCKCSDSNGNYKTCQLAVIVEDDQPPVFTFCPNNQEIILDLNHSRAIAVWEPATATDNSDVASIIQCSASSGDIFGIGLNIVTCVAIDASGNNATCDFQIEMLDDQPPVFTFCPNNQEIILALNHSRAIAVWEPANATDNSGQAPIIQCAASSGDSFGIGLNIVRCAAIDASGNNGTCEFQIEILDIQPPEIEMCPSHQEGVLRPGENTTTVVWPVPQATDNSGIAPFVKCNPPPGSQFALGLTRIVCTAIDGSGNIASCNLHVFVQDCGYQLGMEDGEITKYQISASSVHGACPSIKSARLNSLMEAVGNGGAWCALTIDLNQWIQVNFYIITRVTGVMTQGRNDIDGDSGQWVTKYQVQHSSDEVTWLYIQNIDNQTDQVFEGNWDSDTIVTNVFSTPVQTNLIRIIPIKWNYHISLRFEVLGCEDNCRRKLGMEDGRITSSQLSVSSIKSGTNKNFGPNGASLNARLDSVSNQAAAWCADSNDDAQFIQINMLVETWITGVMLQSRGGHDQWVTEFLVRYSDDGNLWNYIVENNVPLISFILLKSYFNKRTL
ncbi:hyalin-like [Amphiura filiformis]|uniref:hyalin-like n=1 Tax=Amphiura filiformis TaxID=82378 RepID=UPI003B21A7E4